MRKHTTIGENIDPSATVQAQMMPWRQRPGSNQCLCMGCGEHFNSVGAFERHQLTADDGSAICRDPATLTDRAGRPKPMVKNAAGLWILEPMPPGLVATRSPSPAASGTADTALTQE